MKKNILLLAALLISGSAFATGTDEECESLTMNPTEEVNITESDENAPITDTKSLGTFAKIDQALQKTQSDIKFGGYIIGKYSITDKSGADSNGGFDLRLVRLYVDGHAFKDFYYKLQLQVNGAPGEDKGARIVDAFVEWQHFKEFRVKLGQFKRSFGYENPMNPLDVGFGSYSQVSTKLIGFSDRVGEHACNGRDLGLQFQGDFFPAKDGHRWLHYQVGFFNGQGVNHTDKDNFKDLIGGLWISPIKGMRIGGFGWNGKYVNEKYDGAAGTLQSVKRQRLGVSAEYVSDWMVRGEYVWSKGQKVTNAAAANYADGWYLQAGTPTFKNFRVFGRYDCYRDNKKWSSLKSVYELSINYYFNKNLFIQAEYDFTHENSNSVPDKNYNTFGVQLYCRF